MINVIKDLEKYFKIYSFIIEINMTLAAFVQTITQNSII